MRRLGKLATIYPKQACDPEFAQKVNEWVGGIARVYPCRAVHVVEVDRWFGFKWLGFSGKTLGALGIWRKRTTIPPFIRSRVLAERRFLLKGGWADYENGRAGIGLHLWQSSSRNINRPADRIAPDVTLVWYGGGSAAEGRASFMVYVPVQDEGYWRWYVGMKRTDVWEVDRLRGINPRELSYIEAHGKPNVFGPVPKRIFLGDR